MRTSKKDNLREWMIDNAWNLAITFLAIVIEFALLNSRTSALENKLNKYPSEDYFNEKFRVIDESLKEVKDDLKVHVNSSTKDD